MELCLWSSRFALVPHDHEDLFANLNFLFQENILLPEVLVRLIWQYLSLDVFFSHPILPSLSNCWRHRLNLAFIQSEQNLFILTLEKIWKTIASPNEMENADVLLGSLNSNRAGAVKQGLLISSIVILLKNLDSRLDWAMTLCDKLKVLLTNSFISGKSHAGNIKREAQLSNRVTLGNMETIVCRENERLTQTIMNEIDVLHSLPAQFSPQIEIKMRWVILILAGLETKLLFTVICQYLRSWVKHVTVSSSSELLTNEEIWGKWNSYRFVVKELKLPKTHDIHHIFAPYPAIWQVKSQPSPWNCRKGKGPNGSDGKSRRTRFPFYLFRKEE